MTSKFNIKLSEEASCKPFLKRSDKYSVKEISQMLLNTTYKGYNNSVEPLLVLGLASMSRYRNAFFKEAKGFAVAYLHGTTSAGKTNLLNNIAYLFGVNEDYIKSGDSTVLSMWQNLDNVNRIPIIYDEISRKVINDTLFEGLIKSSYQGTNRDKISKIKTSINTTLILSGNFQPPQRPEILNRLLLCNFEQQNFKLDNVIEFNEIRENYLSNLLLAIINYKPNQVIDYFKANRSHIKDLNNNLGSRCIDNIAIAYTGYQILLDIAKASQPDDVKNNFEKFVKFYDQSLKVESPWEEFLKSLPLLARNGKIIAEKDYRYAYDKQEQHENNVRIIHKSVHSLCIHFEQAYNAFAAYYRQVKREFPPSSKELLLYAKNDRIVLPGKTQLTRSININGIKKRCIVIDVQDNYELSNLDKM